MHVYTSIIYIHITVITAIWVTHQSIKHLWFRSLSKHLFMVVCWRFTCSSVLSFKISFIWNQSPPTHSQHLIYLSCCLLIRACHAEHLDASYSKATKQLQDLCKILLTGGDETSSYFIIHQLNWATGKKKKKWRFHIHPKHHEMCCMPNKTSKNRPSICNTNIRSSFSSAKENGWTYYNKLWQNIHSEAISISKKIRTQNGSRLRTDDRLESLLDSINSIIELPE